MNNAFFILVVLALFYSASAFSEKSEPGVTKGSMTEAIKHLKIARENENDVNIVLKHAEMSLKHLKALDREERIKTKNKKDHDLPGAIINIEEAIAHAEMGHADMAKKYIKEALNDMH